ncbi:tetratricopeptide repeat protein [Halomonas sp. 328]|uniref:tetratricopeptide repeat protein n=1 Tax=Halomonas sp. 328 TaxID=2776704 RepID=UPI0018A76054|nr:tetratricopeptide repeat protein [Halomonas sp. 328]MBF8223896.1 hypothetical protein [Halomonas sp. 328]
MRTAWLARALKRNVLGYWPLPLPREREALETLRGSGAWETHTYRRQLGRWERWLVLRPVLHFLRVGWRKRLIPGDAFHTTWYLERYPDVAQAKSNPLLHFLRFGVHEGRLPSPKGVISDFAGLHGSPVWHHHQAWHGHAGTGVLALERLAGEGSADALWYLASWHYGQGQHARALEYLQRLQPLGDGRFAARVPQALAKCCSTWRMRRP